MPKNNLPACRVLISYSHDSELHKKRVAAFCKKLRAEGIEAEIDQFVEFPPEGWPRWMLTKLQSVDYVLVVLSEIYKSRFEGHEEPGKGNGAIHEGLLITQAIYENQSKNAKYIPIYFKANDRKFAPDVLRGVTCYNVSKKDDYDRMYSILTLQQLNPLPPLGEIRSLKQNEIDEHVFDSSDVSGSGVDGHGGVITETASQLIELRINQDFDKFSEIQKTAVLEAIGKLLTLNSPIRVVSMAKGSVLLTLDLTPEQAEKLYWLVKQGELAAFAVTNARMIDSDQFPPTNRDKYYVEQGASQETSLTPLTLPVTHEERLRTVIRIADKMFQLMPDWITFFRAVLGIDGFVRKLFTTAEELAEFEKTAQYAEIQAMVNRLREKSGAAAGGKEPTRVITLRLPKSLHESLRAEAHDRKTSMNQLCISKLLQVIDEQMIVSDFGD